MDSSHLDVLHDHYKESFSHIREREKQRDLLFLILIAILGSLFLEVQYPTDLQELLKGTPKIPLNVLPLPVITSATWTVFLVIMLRYCQNSIIVERQYKYLHKLEDAISFLLKNGSIYTREGRSYLANYPVFSNWVWHFYVWIFPFIVIGLQVYLIYLEFDNQSSVEYNACYDCIMAIGVSISLLLYRGAEIVRRVKRWKVKNKS